MHCCAPRRLPASCRPRSREVGLHLGHCALPWSPPRQGGPRGRRTGVCGRWAARLACSPK
eukprot:4998624-Alexandrium_andersonii.AAC.1